MNVRRKKRKSGLPEYATHIEHARTRKGISQKQLAEILDVGQPVISSWERGVYPPSSKSLAALGNLFKYDAIKFWEWAGIERKRLLIAAASEMLQCGVELKSDGSPEATALLKEIEYWGIKRRPRGEPREVLMDRFAGEMEVTVESAARILELSPNEVLRLVKSGQVKARHIVPKGAPILVFRSVSDYRDKQLPTRKRKQ